ncbi:hypothetical protein [Natrinema pellirubrum]|uniref:hypothetical protein n=1 Tax=Natrinema pellirubrum TaxID=69525 RepID=UPI0012680163|nr:hypothetical protein [Natrinema pellirubrum]
MFDFQFESPGTTDLYVRLVGQRSVEYNVIYIIPAITNVGEEQPVTVGECTSEAEVMKTTEEVLHVHQQSIRTDDHALDELDIEALEAIVGRYRYGSLSIDFERSSIRFSTHRKLIGFSI